MITIKNKTAIARMQNAGRLLNEVFAELSSVIKADMTTLEVDNWIADALKKRALVSKSLGYHGYRHVSCISVNDEVVHGVPSAANRLKEGDLVKVDVCASHDGYCADMARPFVIGVADDTVHRLITVAQQALDKGIEQARTGNRLSDISAAIQHEVESNGFGVVRDFAGHGIGKSMHEDPEVLNYGSPGKGPLLQEGMALALEPMITTGNYKVYVESDGWTVKTVDHSLAAHVEDTIIITHAGPKIVTRG